MIGGIVLFRRAQAYSTHLQRSSVRELVLVSGSWCKGSNSPSIKGLVVDEEWMVDEARSLVGVRLLVLVFCSVLLKLIVRWQ